MDIKNKYRQGKSSFKKFIIKSPLPKALKMYLFRELRFLDGISKDQKGLEIGPSHHPAAPKKCGYAVEIVDWLDQNGLKEHYRNDGINLDAIEPVDYVWHGESYYELIQKDNYYDYIIASHMIEHSTNLAGFFNDCSKLLKKEGVLRLAVPDKRYCFDHYRHTTGLAEVINNLYTPCPLQSAGNVAEYYMNAVSRKGRISWNKPVLPIIDFVRKHHNKSYKPVHDTGTVLYNIQKAYENNYIDIHHYVFTPASFELLIYD